MISLLKKILFGVLLLALLGGCKIASTSEYSGRSKDLNLISAIKSDEEKYDSNRSILWVEKGYLQREEAISLQIKIDNAIMEIENFIAIKFNKKVYKKDKIEYFIHSRQEASHTITGYNPRKYMSPVVFLSYANEKRAPYVHETVHIIAWDWNTLWIKEGLAIFLNDKLEGYPAFPNFGKDIDTIAKNNLASKYPLKLIGRNGIPKFSNRKERRLFYIFSGSFFKYLYAHIEIEKLMKIYTAKDTQKAVSDLTGKTTAEWKQEWLDSLSLIA